MATSSQRLGFHPTMVLSKLERWKVWVERHNVSIPLWFFPNSMNEVFKVNGRTKFPSHYGSFQTMSQYIGLKFSRCFHPTMVLSKRRQGVLWGRGLHVSIPLWFFPNMYKSNEHLIDGVSIPLWFFPNVSQGGGVSEAKNGFPSHYGSFQTCSPVWVSPPVRGFHPTMVLSKLSIARSKLSCDTISFHPTMVLSKQ